MGKNRLQICYIASGMHLQMMPQETCNIQGKLQKQGLEFSQYLSQSSHYYLITIPFVLVSFNIIRQCMLSCRRLHLCWKKHQNQTTQQTNTYSCCTYRPWRNRIKCPALQVCYFQADFLVGCVKIVSHQQLVEGNS